MVLRCGKNVFQFFFSEMFSDDEILAGFFVEHNRLLEHTSRTADLMQMITDSLPEDKKKMSDLLIDRPGILGIMIHLDMLLSTHLREGLKLHSKLMKHKAYQEFIKELSPENKAILQVIEEQCSEFEEKKGFLFRNLKPVRDIFTHYDVKKASEWYQVKKRDEQKKPVVPQSIDFPKHIFGVGNNFEKSVCESKIIFSEDSIVGFGNLRETTNLAGALMRSSELFIRWCLRRYRIPDNRPVNWWITK